MHENNVIAERSPARRITDKMFGGIIMSWVRVILFAVITAVLSAVFLLLPVFDHTSFREMGVTFEAWIFFAIIIMTNCKKPLESALKVFVFFLISQPLIYLIQIPFSEMGWSLFGYYRTWFIWTLFTFPMAYAGWYLKKQNWLSLLILTPINLMLASIGWGFFRSNLILSFPSHLISVLFCFGQIVLYLYAFFRGWKYITAGALAVIAAVVILIATTNMIDVSVGMPLPEDPVLSDSAVVRMADESYGEASLTVTNGEGYLRVHMTKRGKVMLIVTDGDREFNYIAEVTVKEGRAYISVIPQQELEP